VETDVVGMDICKAGDIFGRELEGSLQKMDILVHRAVSTEQLVRDDKASFTVFVRAFQGLYLRFAD
jgi:hypothetical protein